ncbi:hypothetical protein [Zobellella aerophila]|uniref:General secretion pathway protein GspN n=1 Tax=Zobellella aerophila TaxID=870480 RepID=A0ABP6WEC2_9GAMM
MNSLVVNLLIMALPALLNPPVYGQQDSNSWLSQASYPPLKSFQEIITRPLFDEGRRPRPPQDAESTSETATALREKWRLTGVVWEGEQQLALFSERQGAGRLRLKTDMYLDGGWQLQEIQAEAVILTDGEQQLQLTLREPRPAPETMPKSAPTQLPGRGKQEEKTEANNDNQG